MASEQRRIAMANLPAEIGILAPSPIGSRSPPPPPPPPPSPLAGGPAEPWSLSARTGSVVVTVVMQSYLPDSGTTATSVLIDGTSGWGEDGRPFPAHGWRIR